MAFTRLRMTRMGLGTMPHVGPHPGLGFFFVMVTFSAVGVAQQGLLPMLAAPMFMAGTIGPIVLYGAYARARTSLNMTRKAHLEAILQAYTDLHFEAGTRIRFAMMPMEKAAGGWVPEPGNRKLHIWVDSRAHHLPPHILLLCEQALTPLGIFAIPAQYSTHVAMPFPSAHARIQAAARIAPPPETSG